MPIALLCAGSALTADAVITVVWQEPLSAIYATHQQHVLAGQLLALQKAYAPSELHTTGPVSPQRRLAGLAQHLERTSHAGQALGRIAARAIGMNFVIVQGTDTSSLTKGPGHYRSTTLPGTPGTTALAGHRTTFLAPFRRVDELRRGSSIVLTMPYGRFSYVVLGQRVVSPTDVSVLNQAVGPTGSRLVLTTCDPLYSAAKRRIVVAKLVRAVPTRGASRV